MCGIAARGMRGAGPVDGAAARIGRPCVRNVCIMERGLGERAYAESHASL